LVKNNIAFFPPQNYHRYKKGQTQFKDQNETELGLIYQFIKLKTIVSDCKGKKTTNKIE
jgi:hypothetical protein